MNEFKEKVDNFNTKYKAGFIKSEIEILLKDYPNINHNKFWNAMRDNTCAILDGNIIRYHGDVLLALLCGIEDRDMHDYELD